MTDAEIIKALECCVTDDYDESCVKCPARKHKGCDYTLHKNALDLINRQKAEIEMLKEKDKILSCDIDEIGSYITIWDCDCSEYGEQLVMAVEDLSYLPFCNATKIKTEAIKEFAERVKEQLDDFYHTDEDALFDTCDAIDNLVKEMVGDTE